MPRTREEVQVNGNRCRMVAYHLSRGKPAYVYAGKDKDRATRLAPYLRAVINEATDLESAQQAVNHLLAAQTDEEVKARVAVALKRQYLKTTARPDPLTGDQLVGQAVNPEFLDRHPEKYPEVVQAFFPRVKGLADRIRARQEAEAAGCRYRLSDCVAEWKRYKQLEGLSAKHLKAYEDIWNQFVKLIGNKPTNQLEKRDFARWQSHLLKTKGDRSGKWFNDRLIPISGILRHCKGNKSEVEFDFPAGITDWIDFTDSYQTYKPGPGNRKPLPVDVFKALLAFTEEAAGIDVDQYAASMPLVDDPDYPAYLQRGNNKKRANSLKRAGIQWSAIIRYAVNTGADNSDICLLEWGNLHLNAKTPHVEIRRNKTDEFRTIPLLPATVRALKRWQEYGYNPAGLRKVFVNDKGLEWESDDISKRFAAMIKAIPNGNGWSFKHCRNVGPNVGKAASVSIEQREAFLGHSVKGTNRFYEEGAGAEWLVSLVNAIGKIYFDGEVVSGK